MENLKLAYLLLNVFEDEDVQELEVIDEDRVEVDGDTYLVVTDEEATQSFKDYQQGLWDDCGITAFSEWGQEYILNNFVNKEWFEEAMREYNESYVEDIKHEEGRLQDEMESAGVDTEEEYVDYLCNQYDDAIQWYRDDFGMNVLMRLLLSII